MDGVCDGIEVNEVGTNPALSDMKIRVTFVSMSAYDDGAAGSTPGDSSYGDCDEDGGSPGEFVVKFRVNGVDVTPQNGPDLLVDEDADSTAIEVALSGSADTIVTSGATISLTTSLFCEEDDGGSSDGS